MFPAIKDGDLMLGFRLQHTFLKNDVVVYEQDGKMHVGRILGQDTDVITLDDTGTLLVNGTAQKRRNPLSYLCKKRNQEISLYRT